VRYDRPGHLQRAFYCLLSSSALCDGGAPRPMKMGNILSPWRYDAAAGDTLQLASTVIGIDIGENSFHVVGLSARRNRSGSTRGACYANGELDTTQL
jgi:hypothetical protein